MRNQTSPKISKVIRVYNWAETREGDYFSFDEPISQVMLDSVCDSVNAMLRWSKLDIRVTNHMGEIIRSTPNGNK